MPWTGTALVARGEERMPGPNLMRDRIEERLATLGLSRNAASRKAGLATSYVADLLEGRSKNPQPSRLSALAAALECDVGYLLGTQGTPRLRAGQSDVLSFPGAEARMPLTLKLYAVNLTDPDGFFPMNDNETIPYVPAQSVEGRTEQSYAVAIASDMNAPRYLPGEVAIVSLRQPISPGCFALIRKTDDRAAIFRIDSVGSDAVNISTLKDGEKSAIRRSEIKAIHRVIASFEH